MNSIATQVIKNKKQEFQIALIIRGLDQGSNDLILKMKKFKYGEKS